MNPSIASLIQLKLSLLDKAIDSLPEPQRAGVKAVEHDLLETLSDSISQYLKNGANATQENGSQNKQGLTSIHID